MEPNKPFVPTMHPLLRDQFVKVCGGVQYNMFFLYHVARHKECAAILNYLVREKLTGRSLAGFIHEKCKDSPIHFLGKITKAIAKTNTPPALLLGVNFR